MNSQPKTLTSNRERNNLATIEHLITVTVTAYAANHTIIRSLPTCAQMLVAEKEQSRGILGVIDGISPKEVETKSDIEERKEFLRTIGYKL